MRKMSNSLPPNVSGKVRGYLVLEIENILWKTSKTFTDVKTNILWWGEKDGTLCEDIKIEIDKRKSRSSLATLNYNIKTTKTLFQSYLASCDPIQIDIFSTKTGDFIGSCRFCISEKFRLIKEGEEKSERFCASILSPRKFSLGEMVINLKVLVGDEVTMINKILPSSAASWNSERFTENKKKKSVNALSNANSNKENIEVVGKKKQITLRQPKPYKVSTLHKLPENPLLNKRKVKSAPIPKTSLHVATKSRPESLPSSSTTSSEQEKRSSLFNFLSGASMSLHDERKFLTQLATLSPSQSIIESIDNVQSKVSKPKFLNKIDSIKITISNFDLNSVGKLEVQDFINKAIDHKFVLKCAITSKIFKSHQDIKIISSVFESAPQRISFNKEIIQRINLPSDQNTFVNFGFCVKSIELQSLAFFVGFTRINFSDIIRSNGTFHKSCLIVNESDLKVGCFNVKLELGINELHFGKHLMDALYGHKENISISLSNNQDFVPQNKPVTLIHQNVQTQTHPSHSNDDCDADRDYGNKNLQTDKSSANKNRNNLNFDIESDEKDSQMVDVGKENSNLRTKVYRGLLFIEGLRNVKDQLQSEYFITYDGFWNECQESTESYDSFTFNYLKQFPVICDDSFLKKVQNNHLELKLWEKTSRSEKWLGSTRVPLHQFYIAFRDVAMIEHLSTNQLPIISIDTWCNFISPLSSELFCQGKVLLAIGNENQIEYFKLMRNLHNLPLPVRNKSAAVQVDSNIQIKNKLSAFIESLSQKLPEPSVTNNHFQKNSAVSSSAASSSSLSSRNQPELRKTSELIETLQKALAQPPPNVNFTTPPSAAVHQQHVESDSSSGSISQNIIKMLVSIEHATHLPEVVIKKKHNRRKNKNSSAPQRTEFEPSTYATFETSLERINENLLPENVVKSHEGFVHCTKVVKSSCDPQWNQEFNVQLPLDILMNPQKRFVVKVWRKVAQDSEMKAAPFEDAVIGFSAVDLSVLMTGLPVLSGYYNIMDFSGRCNGQIKLSFKPLDDLLQYQDSSTSLPIMQSLMHPLNIDVGSSDDGSNLLSRTLKRKFTELDEITQRLKARLFDVTGDENFDPEDEFERDLNTAVDEMDEDEGNQQDFAWLKQNPIEMQLNALLDSQPSTSKGFVEKSPILPAQREVSGCSSDNPPHMGIDQLLKKYDLDTLINPNIFKNILDPTLANSDSTPTLNPQPINVDVSGDSGDTTVSSILSNDQVQTIQKAFQKASLAEGSESSSRKDPDGENNFSE